MITAKNLKRAGFVPGECRKCSGPGDIYRSWRLEISPKCGIEVNEVVMDGRIHFDSPYIILGKEYHRLNLDSVSKILTLKELLK